jgi:hypothetical protein
VAVRTRTAIVCAIVSRVLSGCNNGTAVVIAGGFDRAVKLPRRVAYDRIKLNGHDRFQAHISAALKGPSSSCSQEHPEGPSSSERNH